MKVHQVKVGNNWTVSLTGEKLRVERRVCR